MKDLKRLLHFVRPYSLPLILSVLLLAIAGGSQAMVFVLVGPIFDRVLNPGASNDPLKLFTVPFTNHSFYLQQGIPSSGHDIWTVVALAILLVFFVKGITDYAGSYLVTYVGVSAVTDMRQHVFENVLRQDLEFFESQSTGQIMSSIMIDLEKIQVATSTMLADFLRQSFTVVALLCVLLQLDRRLAIVSVTVLPFVLVPTIRLGRRIRRTTRTAQDNAAELNHILQESISGQQVVKSFASEAIEAKRFQDASSRLRSMNLRYVAQQAVASPLIEFFGAITIVCLLTYARLQIKAGHMTTGEFTSFVLALLGLYEPVKRLTGIHNIFQQAAGASQKVFEYLDREIRICDRPGALNLTKFSNSIVFDAVSFRYPNSPNGFALKDIQLTVNPGEVVALVGPSGAGKTTLANLTPRFYDVVSGAIRVDGNDVRDLRISSLRQNIGLVAQDTFLFNGSVADNIRYGRPTAAENEVREAARNALAEEFIERLPEGYSTLIGERGAKLSGGQRQRLAIARALLKNVPILILDEATSHLDTESEVLVQRALANLMEHRTVIVIAHRLSTIRRADKIVVLDRGRITEIGSHEDLINQGGIYQRLHELQFLEADPLANS